MAQNIPPTTLVLWGCGESGILKAIFPVGHPYIDSSQESYEELKEKITEHP